MALKEQLEFLETEVLAKITKMKRYADRDKWRTYTVSISSAALGATITVLLGIKSIPCEVCLKHVALFF